MFRRWDGKEAVVASPCPPLSDLSLFVPELSYCGSSAGSRPPHWLILTPAQTEIDLIPSSHPARPLAGCSFHCSGAGSWSGACRCRWSWGPRGGSGTGELPGTPARLSPDRPGYPGSQPWRPGWRGRPRTAWCSRPPPRWWAGRPTSGSRTSPGSGRCRSWLSGRRSPVWPHCGRAQGRWGSWCRPRISWWVCRMLGDICRLPRCISCWEKLTLSKSIILYPRLDELLPIYRFLWSKSSQYINQLKQHHQQQWENRPDARAGVQGLHPQRHWGGDHGAALLPLTQLLHRPQSLGNLAGETLRYTMITTISRTADDANLSLANDSTWLTS